MDDEFMMSWENHGGDGFPRALRHGEVRRLQRAVNEACRRADAKSGERHGFRATRETLFQDHRPQPDPTT